MSKESWENLYKEHECVFGVEPSVEVRKLLEYLQSGKVMDLGAGEGRNSLFLAAKGFDVTALDHAEAGVEKLKKFAAEKGIKNIDAHVGDIKTVEIPEGQDAIIAVLVFHQLSRNDALEAIEKMKNATREGGYNILDVITRNSDFFRGDPETERFYSDPGELKELYKDWEVLDFGERKWEAAFKKNTDGSPMFNMSEEMIARKPHRQQ